MNRAYRLRLLLGNHFDRATHKLIHKDDVFLSDLPLHKTHESGRFELLEVLNGPPDNEDIKLMGGVLKEGQTANDVVEGNTVIRKVTGGEWSWQFIGVAKVGTDSWYIKNVETGKRISPRKVLWEEAPGLIEEYLDDLE